MRCRQREGPPGSRRTRRSLPRGGLARGDGEHRAADVGTDDAASRAHSDRCTSCDGARTARDIEHDLAGCDGDLVEEHIGPRNEEAGRRTRRRTSASRRVAPPRSACSTALLRSPPRPQPRSRLRCRLGEGRRSSRRPAAAAACRDRRTPGRCSRARIRRLACAEPPRRTASRPRRDRPARAP